MAIKLQITSSDLAALMEKHPELEVEIKHAVVERILKDRVIKAVDNSSIMHQVRSTLKNQIADAVNRDIGNFIQEVPPGGSMPRQVFKLKPDVEQAVNEAIKKCVDAHINDLVIRAEERIMAKIEYEIRDKIITAVDEAVERRIRDEIKKRLDAIQDILK